MRIDIAILAGGSSSRLGRDKASIVWNGRTILQRIAEEALKTSSSVLVVGRECPSDWDLDRVSFILDSTPHLGPLGGLRTALLTTEADAVAAVACDMPLLKSASFRWLLENGAGLPIGSDGLAVSAVERIEPLFSVYTKRCLPKIDEMIAKGQRALYKLIEYGSFVCVSAPHNIENELANFNTPEDWSKLSDSGEEFPDMRLMGKIDK